MPSAPIVTGVTRTLPLTRFLSIHSRPYLSTSFHRFVIFHIVFQRLAKSPRLTNQRSPYNDTDEPSAQIEVSLSK
jgi:hypothetical protein